MLDYIYKCNVLFGIYKTSITAWVYCFCNGNHKSSAFCHVLGLIHSVFESKSYYLKLSSSLGYFFVNAIKHLIGANVSFSRVENYLKKEELKKINDYKKADKPFIKVTNLTTKWTKVKLRYNFS